VKVKFDYERVAAIPSFADPSPFVARPVVPITIWGSTQAFRTKGILDTGATETILPYSLIAEGLIDPINTPGETGAIYGIDQNPMPVTYWTVDLAVTLKKKTHRWQAKVAFTTFRNDVVLGNAGFLRYFTVTFDGANLYSTLRPNGSFPAGGVNTQ
jgi:hypothetical protein